MKMQVKAFDLQSQNFYIYNSKQGNSNKTHLISVHYVSIGCSRHLVSRGNKVRREVAKIVSVFSVVGKQVSISIDNTEQQGNKMSSPIQH